MRVGASSCVPALPKRDRPVVRWHIPLQPSTIKTRFQNARSVLRAAKRDKMLAEDPTEAITPDRLLEILAEHARQFVGSNRVPGCSLTRTAPLGIRTRSAIVADPPRTESQERPSEQGF